MKTNKKDFFANYGLELVDSDHIMAPWGEVVPMPLTKGSKTLCFGWSTLAGTGEWTGIFNGEEIVVRGTCVCDCDHCYAKRGKYTCPDVINGNIWRTIAARNYSDWLEKAITAQIQWGDSRKPYDLIRVHVAGDFFSEEYIQMWHRIASTCTETRFWSYTKNPVAETAYDDLANFNIVRSIVPNFGVNYGDAAYVVAMYEALVSAGVEVYICRCAMDEPDVKEGKKTVVDNHQHCKGCKGCSVNKYVLFLQHGVAGYNKHKDPMYPVLCALIENQPSMLI